MINYPFCFNVYFYLFIFLFFCASGDGEDNLILGLNVDKVSQNENVKFTLGEEETEVAPSCILVCLTLDGKISLFHFARYFCML